MISIEQVAVKAGVSRMTISRIFDARYAHQVKPATRERVMAVCKKYNYFPKSSARSLAMGRTLTIGLIMTDLSSAFASPTLAPVIDAIANELQKHGYNLQILYSPDDSKDALNKKILETLYSRSVDAFIINSMMLETETIDRLATESLPAVIFSMPTDTILHNNINYVCVDNEPGTLKLVQHLIQKGHQKIAYIDKKKRIRRTREEIFYNAARAEGLAFSRDDIFELEKKSRSVQEIFNSYQHILNNWDQYMQYSAWVFSNDLLAAGGIQAVRSKGLEPGRDIAIAGYDNIEENPNYSCVVPEITTIAPSHKNLGITAVNILLEQINNKWKEAVSKSITAELIIRKSTEF